MSDSVLHASHASIYMSTHVHEYRKEKLKKVSIIYRRLQYFHRGPDICTIKTQTKTCYRKLPKVNRHVKQIFTYNNAWVINMTVLSPYSSDKGYPLP